MGVYELLAMIAVVFVTILVIFPFYTVIDDTLIPMLRPKTSAQGQQVIDIVDMAVLFWGPLLLIIGAIIYGIASMEKKEYTTTGI